MGGWLVCDVVAPSVLTAVFSGFPSLLCVLQPTRRAISRQIKEVEKLVKMNNEKGGFSL